MRARRKGGFVRGLGRAVYLGPEAATREPCAQNRFYGLASRRLNRSESSDFWPSVCAHRHWHACPKPVPMCGVSLRRHLPSAVWVAARPQSPARTRTDRTSGGPRAAKQSTMFWSHKLRWNQRSDPRGAALPACDKRRPISGRRSCLQGGRGSHPASGNRRAFLPRAHRPRWLF